MEINYFAKAQLYKKEGKTVDEIIAILTDEGLSNEEINTIIAKLKEEFYAKLRVKGFVYVGIGACLLFLCFIILFSMEFDHPFFHYILYGITTAGACLVLYGMVNVLGW